MPVSPPPVRASVVVITKNQRTFLERSLPVLVAQKEVGGNVEIIVVDSGSTDGAQAVVAAHGARLVPLPPQAFNYARAHNAGAHVARGAFLVRLSGDAIPASEFWLRELLTPFDTESRVTVTWGRQIFPSNVRNPLEKAFEAVMRPAKRMCRYTRPVTVLGCSMAVRRTTWQAHPYDERLPQAEDYAFFRACVRNGQTGVYVPTAPVLHGHDEGLWRALRRSLGQSVLQALILAGAFDDRPRPVLSSNKARPSAKGPTHPQ